MILETLLFCFVFSGIGLAKNDTGKAKTAMETSARSEKFIKLKQRIKENPNDAKALFQLGACYIKAGKHAQANKFFARAKRFNPTYDNRIGQEYAKAGNKQLQDGRIRQARILFQKAISFTPGMRIDIAKGTFLQGKRLFDQGLYEMADERFAITNSLDDAYGTRICNMFFTLGNSLDAKKSIVLYRLASWYCSDHNEDIGLRMLKIAKNQTSKEWTAIYKEEAAKYVSDETVRAVFPNPSWKTVHASIYKGKGYDDGDSPEYHIRTVRFGKDVLNGDKIVVESEGGFKIWDAGWDQYESKYEFLSKDRTAGDYFYVEGPKEKKIIVKVQRYY
jgi:tetratricopeptide (TPR) repeat protein